MASTILIWATLLLVSSATWLLRHAGCDTWLREIVLLLRLFIILVQCRQLSSSLILSVNNLRWGSVLTLAVEETVSWLGFFHEVTQISRDHGGFIDILRDVIILVLIIADRWVLWTHLTGSHHLAMILHLISIHIRVLWHVIISLISLSLLVIYFNSILQSTLLCALVWLLLHHLILPQHLLLLLRVILVKSLVILDGLSFARVVLHLADWFDHRVPLLQTLTTTNPVVQMSCPTPVPSFEWLDSLRLLTVLHCLLPLWLPGSAFFAHPLTSLL